MMDISDFSKLLKGYEWRENKHDTLLQLIRWAGYMPYAVAPGKRKQKMKTLFPLAVDNKHKKPLVTEQQFKNVLKKIERQEAKNPKQCPV